MSRVCGGCVAGVWRECGRSVARVTMSLYRSSCQFAGVAMTL